MGLVGRGWKMILERQKELEKVSRGAFTEEIGIRWRKAFENLITEEFTTMQSPYGKTWRGTHGDSLSMTQTGELRNSVSVAYLGKAFQGKSPIIRLALSGKAAGRHSTAHVQAYGGMIVTGAPTSGAAYRSGARVSHLQQNVAKKRGLMKFRLKNGRWISTYKTIHNGNPVIPTGPGIPPRWEGTLRHISESMKMFTT